MRPRPLALILAAGLIAGACKSSPATPVAAAKVENPVKETDLTTVTLTADAERRLGIVVDTVRERRVPPTRTLGGEVVTPPGQTFPLLAPIAASVVGPPGGSLPRPGTMVARGQALLRLVPLPPAADLARGQEDLTVAEARADQAEREAARARELARDSLISQRDLERINADLIAARAVLASARARLTRQESGQPGAGPGITPLTIAAPESGIVLDLAVGAGQVVAAGAPLITIANTGRLWVRASIFSGDASQVPPGARAHVDLLQNDPATRSLAAVRVTSPPTSDPGSASADLHFELARHEGLRPGQRVSITIDLKGAPAPERVVPLSAVVYDQAGGSWVYVKQGDRRYTRQRVDISRVAGDWAVLVRGPAKGVLVVSTGVAELFGTEFGAGK